MGPTSKQRQQPKCLAARTVGVLFISVCVAIIALNASAVLATHELQPIDGDGNSARTMAGEQQTLNTATPVVDPEPSPSVSVSLSSPSLETTSSSTAPIEDLDLGTTSKQPWRPPLVNYYTSTSTLVPNSPTEQQNVDLNVADQGSRSDPSSSSSLIVILVGSVFVLLVVGAAVFFIVRSQRQRAKSISEFESGVSGLDELSSFDPSTGSLATTSAKSAQSSQGNLINAYGKYQPAPARVERKSHQFHFVAEAANPIVSSSLYSEERKSYELDSYSCATSFTSGELLEPGSRNKKVWPFPWSPTEFSDAGTTLKPKDGAATPVQFRNVLKTGPSAALRAAETDFTDYESYDGVPQEPYKYDPDHAAYDSVDSKENTGETDDDDDAEEPPSDSDSEDLSDADGIYYQRERSPPAPSVPPPQSFSPASKKILQEHIDSRMATQKKGAPGQVADHIAAETPKNLDPAAAPLPQQAGSLGGGVVSGLKQGAQKLVGEGFGGLTSGSGEGALQRATVQQLLQSEPVQKVAGAVLGNLSGQGSKKSSSSESSYAVKDLYQNFAGNFQLPIPLNGTDGGMSPPPLQQQRQGAN